MRDATAGETVDLVTTGLERPKVVRVLRAAVDRGVFVRVHTLSEVLTPREKALMSAIGKSSGSGTGVRQCLLLPRRVVRRERAAHDDPAP